MSLDIDDPPLDQAEAVRLDEQIQAMADEAGEHLDHLAQLLAEAKAGQIHQALKFESWTAYLVDRLKPITKALDAYDRRALIGDLYEAGMSVRAIAEAVGTSKSTVARQVSQSGTGEGETTGLDGNTYKRRHGGGGHRGPMDAVMKLKRVGSMVANITGLEPDDAEKQSEICRLIDQLLASIQPATVST